MRSRVSDLRCSPLCSSALPLFLAACGASANEDAVQLRESASAAPELVHLAQETAPAGQVSSDLLRSHVEFLAQTPRTADTELAAARTYCRDHLADLGYTIYEESFDFTNPLSGGTAQGVNIHGYKEGDTNPGEMVMISAHLDSIAPSCPGANDNASGVAGVLEIARLLAEQPHRRSTIATCWDAEEAGAVGSYYNALAARSVGYDIKINFVFDMIGWYSDEPNTQRFPGGTLFASAFPAQAQKVIDQEYRGNFVGVVGNGYGLGGAEGGRRYEAAFRQAADAIGLRTISIFPSYLHAALMQDVLRSDHSSFWANGYNALFITDTGEFRRRVEGGGAADSPVLGEAYHCLEGVDSIDGVNFDFTRKIAQATFAAAQSAADE